MFLKMNRETLFNLVRAFFPGAKITRVLHPEYGDGGDICLRADRTIAFDEFEDGQCEVRVCTLDEKKDVIATQDFATEEELANYLKQKKFEWSKYGYDLDVLSAKISNLQAQGMTMDQIAEKAIKEGKL
jgi:hypothetical protein